MGRRKSPTDLRVRVLVTVACVSVGYMLTLPVYTGLKAIDAALVRLLRPHTAPPYLVATATMEPGHVVSEDDVAQAETPGFAPTDAVADPGLLIGRTVQERILEGDAMRLERMSARTRRGIAALVPTGFRALSIHVTDADRVAGFVEAGDHVDVLVSLFDVGKVPETVRLLEDITVLSVDDHLAEQALGETPIKPQVMLLVTPDDANRLTHALRHGHPRLVLRPELGDFIGPLP